MKLATDTSFWDHLPSSAYRRRAFGKYLEEARRRIDLLWAQTDTRCHSIAHKLSMCCEFPQIISMNDGERYYLTESRCRSRICPRCAKIRANMLAQRIAGLVTHMNEPRFLTLTCRSNSKPLREQLKFLRRRFAALRKTPLWQNKVDGGVYTIEITYSTSRRQWHPHIHAIIDGSYFPHEYLLQLWSSILKDDGGVDIRQVYGTRKIANYLACYVSKSCDLHNFEPDQLCEWAIETHSLRLAQTFGSLHANKPANDRQMIAGYKKLDVDVNHIALKAEAGDEKCEEILRALSGRNPCDRPDFIFMVRRAVPPPPYCSKVIELRVVDPQILIDFD